MDSEWAVDREEFRVVCKGEEITMPLYGNMRVQDVYTFSLIGSEGSTRVQGISTDIRTRPFGNPIEDTRAGAEEMIGILNTVAERAE